MKISVLIHMKNLKLIRNLGRRDEKKWGEK